MRIIIDIPDFEQPLDMQQTIIEGVGTGEHASPPVTLGEMIAWDIINAINNDSALAMHAIWVPHHSCVSFAETPAPEAVEYDSANPF